MKDELTKEFLSGINEVQPILLLMNFSQYSFVQKGSSYFISFKKEGTFVDFLFGPSDWDIEMVIHTSNGKFAFKDLLQLPSIADWVDRNRYEQFGGRNIKNELLWYVDLLKFSLPLVE